MRLRILGPVEYLDGGEWSPIASAKQRALLATLVLHANQVVPVDRLLAELWPDRAPASASGLLAGYVWRLRKQLTGTVLQTRAPGYQLLVPQGMLDVHEYDRLVAQGRASAAEGDLSAAASSFGRALAIWRDVPLADVPLSPAVMAERARLEESQLAVIEARIGAQIGLGQHEALLPELKQLVAQFPLRERLHAHLMLVLYRCGHQADALGAYRDLRRLLVGELGIEPSKPLRELHQRILVEDPELVRGREPARPKPVEVVRPLPTVHGVVGHTAELDAVVSLLSGGEQVCAVHGLAGAGKTTLLLRAAHALAPHFPDGQVYLDVRGSAADRAMRPEEVVDAVRRLSGSAQRVLVVLDDVGDPEQVRPLLDPAPGSALLIGGRLALDSVGPRGHVHLGRMTADTALSLLRSALGPVRVDAERAAASEVARLCEYSPLALGLAAARLATRPEWRLHEFAARLADPRRRLDLLAHGGHSVRASLHAGVRLLHRWADRSAITALSLLGVLDLPVVSEHVLAALLGEHVERAEAVVDRLVDAGLVERLRIDSYRIPDMVRLVAREQQPSDVDAEAAVSRVVRHYVGLVEAQLELLGEPSATARGLAWYRRELGTLRALSMRDCTDALHKAVDELRWSLSHGRPRVG